MSSSRCKDGYKLQPWKPVSIKPFNTDTSYWTPSINKRTKFMLLVDIHLQFWWNSHMAKVSNAVFKHKKTTKSTPSKTPCGFLSCLFGYVNDRVKSICRVLHYWPMISVTCMTMWHTAWRTLLKDCSEPFCWARQE